MWTCNLIFSLCILVTGCTGSLVTSHKVRKVCVIGAGYSGLAIARYMRQYGLNFTVFEATRHIGGTWRFDPHVGHDADGVPVFSSAYRKLRTNTPRQTMEYEGFPFPKQIPAFPSGVCIYNYLQSFSKHFDVLKYIQFRSLVTSIKWKTDRWALTYHKTDSKNTTTETCDFVVIATGYFGKPYEPKFEGQESFQGNIIHSHQYKDENPYVDRTVAIIGDGPSGRDLVMILAKVSSIVFFSHHHELEAVMVPENIITKPDIKLFTSNGIIFEDDSFEEIDAVILCTGYEFENNILDQNTEIATSSKILMPLYEHMVNIKHPSMAFVGKSKTSMLRVYDAQAQYVAALAAQKFEVPSLETMTQNWMEHVHSLFNSGLSINDINLITHTNNYYSHLRAKVGLKRDLPSLRDIVRQLKTMKLFSPDENYCPGLA